MQEQPPSDPPRREPAPGARRSRSPKPTFAAPPTPEPPVPPTRQPEADSGPPSGARRAKAAPAVLFQPPDLAQAAPRTPVRGERSSGAEGRTGPTATAAPRPRPATRAAPPGDPDDPATRAVPTPPTGDPATEATPAPGAEDPATEATRPPGDENPAAAAGPQAVPTGRRAEPARTGPDPVQPGSVADEEAPQRTRRARVKKASAVKKASPAKKAAPDKDGTRAATPKKATPARKTTGRPSQPGPATVVVPAADGVEPASGRTAGVEWRAITSRVLGHPAFAPELLALAAVEALGPRAREWVGGLRDTYPDADADGLARLATRRFVRLAGAGGAVAAGAGLFAPVAELAAVLWAQAHLVLHLAAAYDRDPAHPDRAAELLVLTQVHPDAGSARAALDAARAADGPGEGPWPRAAEAAWRLATPLAAQAGGWLGLRLASRLLPGAAALAAAAGDAAAAERLAARAIAAYRPPRVPGR
ncbi:hypothetical protein OG799_29505 [Micromonospora sp. NBC_00898]|uniref:hypothetical protein n=1 Tax=Micromonospora sp. NBC_00898 TaxID=2975981 RepID=UPI00386E988B|nr:hypothetical protein OG799_29505 [Micromonospora sp. NBC_00898]